MASPVVLVIVDDLFFLAKIQTTLTHLGLTAQVATQRSALCDVLTAEALPALALVDLTLRTADAVALIQDIKAATPSTPVPILAFGAHVAVDIRQQALQAGADQVVAKSAFAQHLPALIQQFVGQE
ncbi:MAG: response regulator [Candidatus Tectomicrobia bacterium]|uniref:Response regulator n=1 Tax=Tectimicrobiota bacterium TaxID=2528274 RepID=A0A937W1Y6_UNCTE|nr:response regulator [Candidatus Tectomicrobia bacterium]